MRVLLVEDDEPIAESLTRGLSRYGFEVRWVRTGAEALTAGDFAVVLVDLGLPDMDGLDVCRELRARGDVPIIVISARSDEVDRVVGLEIGADDYVTKPFGVREVVARMRAVLRRAQPALREPETHGRVRIDRRGRRVHLDGGEVELTPKEFDLLAFLAEEPGAVFTREQIMEAVWDENWFGPTKTLDVHVGVLRRKLGDAASLETVRGVGFRLVLT
ncbi:DNA-binding response regulator, OmpR family, contains REC and winged-helix (wHTH) domain [Lentzea albidocapillata subsp. violacea]|uniref:DNA-binding response regulator, OmpR family, contains REC and winged-helix (WHTH) domain n=1 Tax=Lentzea albidocapillata subsp. violacea TaxID=128104 RepID=A0A1G9RJW7_9PSEU|nr:response regulator transcription factor [Lentzea albidocapillata]SDM23582.1 DNA-binding response regulator, OmpR family, contains REC and winged-helix (wHTH) domain [Lentzea albidocapillata subsp. violacea]